MPVIIFAKHSILDPLFKTVPRKTLNLSTRKVNQFPSHQMTGTVNLINFFSGILKLKFFKGLTP